MCSSDLWIADMVQVTATGQHFGIFSELLRDFRTRQRESDLVFAREMRTRLGAMISNSDLIAEIFDLRGSAGICFIHDWRLVRAFDEDEDKYHASPVEPAAMGAASRRPE